MTRDGQVAGAGTQVVHLDPDGRIALDVQFVEPGRAGPHRGRRDGTSAAGPHALRS